MSIPTRFGLREYLWFCILLPVAVGFVARCYSASVYIQMVLFDDPLNSARIAVSQWLIQSDSLILLALSRCIYFVVADAFYWPILVICSGFTAIPRVKCARIFAFALIVSFPIVDSLLSLTIRSTVSQPAPVLIGRYLYVLVVLCALTGIFVAVYRRRPISNSMSPEFGVRRIVRSCVIIAGSVIILFISVSGWNFLRYSFEWSR
jgi:hypothetical protein